MNAMERVMMAMGHKEPDRVPFVISVTMQGARELGLSIKDYYAKAENIVEAQLRMFKKYRHDALNPTFYGALEMEAWGSPTIFRAAGPPNAGPPLVTKLDDITKLTPPKIEDAPRLQEALKAIRLMKSKVGGTVPLLGVVISPFSAPVMQLGFDRYLELLFGRPDLFARLMAINEEFCVAWANAQLAAGASAIAYADPVSSTTIVTREMYLKTGWQVAKRVIARIKGGVATHFASGTCLPILADIAQTGTVAVGVSALEDLGAIKAACRGKLAVMGNLNAISMRHWTPAQAVAEVKAAIAKAGPGGGYVLSDNHGEIPWQVPDEILLVIADAVHTWGRYPLDWVAQERAA
ncbi:MAG: uroporphyrinogen decarboxylase family protein [Kiritimatiellaeota bacterium]|nr:uroporphyrinogen decarboxylase family protein [Kiritimatiellota bacterium]